ncbi:MAG: lactonase family protein [Lachnospiraceae bacterium]|nr:lactonase family protein [Lachnospiraceae bacterium]
MAAGKKYVAYVSTYTMGDQHGIKIYDVDMKNGRFIEKDMVEISNSSYVTISHDEEFLYSITDFGVESYRIEPDGSLEFMNHASINGMRGCYLSTDYDEKFLFVAGYHDGKITGLRLLGDGSVGEITEEIYLKGMGTIAERNFRPHVNCVKMTRDNDFLMAADIGMDHVDIYKLNHDTGKLKLVDVLRSEIDSAPRHIKMTKDGKFVYIVHEIKCYIDVYSYRQEDGNPYFSKIQTISTLNDYHAGMSAASALNFSADEKYIVSSNAGDNSTAVFRIDHRTGMLTKLFCLPVSGDYPKDVALFPDNKHLVSLNHESGTMTFFTTDLDKGLIVMNGKEMKIESPNCVIFHRISG